MLATEQKAEIIAVTLADAAKAFREEAEEIASSPQEAEILATAALLNYLATERPAQCAALRTRLLVLLRQSRDPYWDVLIEHGVEPDGPVVDVSERPGRRLAHLR